MEPGGCIVERPAIEPNRSGRRTHRIDHADASLRQRYEFIGVPAMAITRCGGGYHRDPDAATVLIRQVEYSRCWKTVVRSPHSAPRATEDIDLVVAHPCRVVPRITIEFLRHRPLALERRIEIRRQLTGRAFRQLVMQRHEDTG